MYKNRLLLILFFLAKSISSFSQDLQYTHRVIDTLTSPSMDGRGYINKGDKKAAEYIKNEFQKKFLQPVNEDYFQKFKYPVNTFPKRMEVEIDGNPLKPGVDFIVDANSS